MANKVKQIEGYQVKQVLAEKSAELNAFGWTKVKNTTRTIKKKTYVNVRRKIALSKIPGLRPIESKYDKWSKKKIKRNPVGGIFAFLFMLIFFAVALVGLYVGLNDDMIGGKAYEKSIAAYNAAVKTGMVTAEDLEIEEDLKLFEYDDEEEALGETPAGYTAFAKKYIAYSFAGFINNYTNADGDKLDAEEDDATINAFAKEYLKQIEDLGFLGEEEEAVDYDKSLVFDEEKDTYSAKAGLLGPVDGIIDGVVRPLIQGFGIGYKPLFMSFGILLIAGAGSLILFVVCLIAFISICGAKNRIEKRNEIIAESIKEGAELVYGVKVKNRDLMTKTERKMHDMQNMIVRAIHQASEDDDDED